MTTNLTNQKESINKFEENISGVWTSGETDNASFYIDIDSIHYVDALKSYKYVINGDSLTIKFEGQDYKCKILKADKDSLIWINAGDRIVFWRFKN